MGGVSSFSPDPSPATLRPPPASNRIEREKVYGNQEIHFQQHKKSTAKKSPARKIKHPENTVPAGKSVEREMKAFEKGNSRAVQAAK